ncbi:hypothetical protein AOQ84DRAFT_225658, partial [Glonium stellatum]
HLPFPSLPPPNLASTRKRPASFELLHFGRVVQGWSINAAGQLSTWAILPSSQKGRNHATAHQCRASLSESSFQRSHSVRAQFPQYLVPEQHAHNCCSGRLIAPHARWLPPPSALPGPTRVCALTGGRYRAVRRCGPWLDRFTPAAADAWTGGGTC